MMLQQVLEQQAKILVLLESSGKSSASFANQMATISTMAELVEKPLVSAEELRAFDSSLLDSETRGNLVSLVLLSV